MVRGEPQLCGDKSARTAGPRRATCQRIAATRADRAIVTALENEACGILERAAIDADLEHAAVEAVLKVVVVAESKNAVLEDRDRHRRRIESFVTDSSGIINPGSVWR